MDLHSVRVTVMLVTDLWDRGRWLELLSQVQIELECIMEGFLSGFCSEWACKGSYCDTGRCMRFHLMMMKLVTRAMYECYFFGIHDKKMLPSEFHHAERDTDQSTLSSHFNTQITVPLPTQRKTATQRKIPKWPLLLEPASGIEPLACALRERRSTNWAMLAIMTKCSRMPGCQAPANFSTPIYQVIIENSTIMKYKHFIIFK